MVPSAYWPVLALVSASLLVIRLAARGPLLPQLARPVSLSALAVAGVSALVLAFHCSAMFFPGRVDAVPGLSGPAADVRSLGMASRLAYWIPAAVLIVALRRVWWPALVALALALGAVGITMFRWFGLPAHLTAIGAAVLIGVVVLATMVGTPGRPARTPTRAPG